MELRGHDGEGLVGAKRRAAYYSAAPRSEGVQGVVAARSGEPAMGANGLAARAFLLVAALRRQIAAGF